MHSMRGWIRAPGSVSTAIEGHHPSVYITTTVPLAAATAVGVEMPKLDWRARTERDRGLGDRGPHLADHQVQEDDAALILLVVLDLGDQEPAVLGEQDRAGVGQRHLGLGARECPDVVSLHEPGPDHGRDPLGLTLPEDLDAPDDPLELGAGRGLLREGGTARAPARAGPRGRAAATSRSDPSVRRPRMRYSSLVVRCSGYRINRPARAPLSREPERARAPLSHGSRAARRPRWGGSCP